MEPLTRSWISFRKDVTLVRADSAGWRLISATISLKILPDWNRSLAQE